MAKSKEQIIQEAKQRRAQLQNDGTRFLGPVGMVTDGPVTRQSIIQAVLDRKMAEAQAAQQSQEIRGSRPIGIGEAALTMATGAIAEPIAGLVGIATAPFQGVGRGVENIEATRQALTYQPRTEEGKQAIQSAAEFLQPVSQMIEKPSKELGRIGYEAMGPVGGAIGETVIPAALEIAGLKGVGLGRRVARAEISPEARQIIQSGSERGVPVYTTDVLPPENFASRWAQSIYEKIPIIGGAAKRQSQQLARQEAVIGLADEFGLELESIGELSTNMVSAISKKNAETLARAGAQRLRATEVLDPLGHVPMSETFKTIDNLLQEQASLGARADTGLVQKLTDIRSALSAGPIKEGVQQPRNFSGIKDIRTTVIDDLKAINRSDDPRSFSQLQQVKSAIDKDMVSFARQSDPQAAKNWLESNRVFARELEAVRRTELKRAFNSGNTTPEIVLPILRGGKRSELQRLNSALTPNGQRSARAAIIYDALAESGYFSDIANANPDRLANALKRQNRIQAIDVFFTGRDKEALDGFIRLLDSTRRAQQAGVLTPTGQQLVPFAVGGAAFTEPVMAAMATATLSGIGRFYESAGMRNFLLRLNNTKPGSPQEMNMIEAAIPALTASIKSLSEQREEK